MQKRSSGRVPAALETLVIVLLAGLPCRAQLPAAAVPNDQVIHEGPHQRATLVTGTGRVAFLVSSRHPGARKMFDQALGQLHGGAAYEAERSFHEVLRLDPDCAMASLGMALANSGNPGRAVAACWEAFRKRAASPERERLLIEAYARYLGADAEPKTVIVDAESGRRRAIARPPTQRQVDRLLQDLAELVKRFPDDVEIRALLLRERTRASPRAAADLEQLERQILARTPGHPARRYLLTIHAAARESDRLEAAALDAGMSARALGSMWRAGADALARRGRHSGAARLYEAAARADHAGLRRNMAMPYEVHDYAAGVGRMCTSLLRSGRSRGAAAWARYLIELPRHPRLGGDPGAIGRQQLAAALAAPADRAGKGSPGHRSSPPFTDRSPDPRIPRLGPARWTPPAAPGFTLPSGQGGETSLTDLSGHPVLVVFFLGFG